ncbi:MAG: hypothetical protein WC934_11295 [Acidithiobacillus sp.]|jgi:hypothetical protein|uniref:hypothetical protein n=1 Tax=Acidithiobacillus sp. TaxID=1872118 RepID=UPI00355F192C
MAIDNRAPETIMTFEISSSGFRQAVEEGYFGDSVNILGTQGVSGYSGLLMLGVRGPIGFSGYSGLSGHSGYSGYSGISGYSGQQVPVVGGVGIFNGVSGIQVSHNLGTTNHHLSVTPISNTSGFLGDVYVIRNTNEDLVYNSGVNNFSSFSWSVVPL